MGAARRGPQEQEAAHDCRGVLGGRVVVRVQGPALPDRGGVRGRVLQGPHPGLFEQGGLSRRRAAPRRRAGRGPCADAARAILVAGVNEGQLSDVVLRSCRGAAFHGFEIQRDVFRRARQRLRRDHGAARVAMHRAAWSDAAAAKVAYSGEGETASLFVPDERGRFGDWARHAADGVATVPLADVADRLANGSILYVVVDVEGHEPKVLRGMHLERGYAKRFPLFQYELGGTWGHHDPRHNNDWTQGRAAGYLQDAGYEPPSSRRRGGSASPPTSSRRRAF